MKPLNEVSYRQLLDNGELEARFHSAYELLEKCELCPHLCRVDRDLKKGVCKAGKTAVITSYGPHFGEETPLVGTNGSGTIFFAFCNMKCIFCQNSEISWGGVGEVTPVKKLAEIMLHLEAIGCHNINLVTPTHFVPPIIEALFIAAKKGMRIPIVYNCGGYERLETLKILDGIVDIYMPDVKFNKSEVAKALSGVKDYPNIVKIALKEMYRQVGDLQIDEQGVAIKGLIVRHLVLPIGLAGTKDLMEFIAQEISLEAFVNIMRQYKPEFNAHQYEDLNRPITDKEYREALKFATDVGLNPQH